MIALLLWLGANLVTGDVPPCVLWSCSNDPAAVGRDGILGDEGLDCDPSDGATYYEWCGEDGACLTTPGPHVLVAGTPLVASNSLVRIRVRACNDANPDAPAACSEWSGAVEFLPHACTRHVRTVPRGADDYTTESCEFRCFDGAPRRLLTLPEC